jgi:hypothetical protein
LIPDVRYSRFQRFQAVTDSVTRAMPSAATSAPRGGRCRHRNASDPAVRTTTISLSDPSDPSPGMSTKRPINAPERQPIAFAVFIRPSSQVPPRVASAGLRSNDGKIRPSSIADGTTSTAATSSLYASASQKLPSGTTGTRKASCALSHMRICSSTAIAQSWRSVAGLVVASSSARRAPRSSPTRTISSIEENA